MELELIAHASEVEGLLKAYREKVAAIEAEVKKLETEEAAATS